MAYQIFLSPLVKRCALITYKQHGIYDLFHELPNDLKKLGNIKKLPKLHRMIDQRPSHQTILSDPGIILTLQSLKYTQQI